MKKDREVNLSFSFFHDWLSSSREVKNNFSIFNTGIYSYLKIKNSKRYFEKLVKNAKKAYDHCCMAFDSNALLRRMSAE